MSECVSDVMCVSGRAGGGEGGGGGGRSGAALKTKTPHVNVGNEEIPNCWG